MQSSFQYTLDRPVTANEIYFTYKGKFNDLSAIWHVTLKTCYPAQKMRNPPTKRQLLEVIEDKTRAGHYHARLQLNQPKLAQADIIKTIILLNQYKNLRLGIHQWG